MLVTTVGNWDSVYWRPNRNLMEHPSEWIPRGWGGPPRGIAPSLDHYHHHPGWWLEKVLEEALGQKKHTLSLKWKAVNMPEPLTAASGRLGVARCVGRVPTVPAQGLFNTMKQGSHLRPCSLRKQCLQFLPCVSLSSLCFHLHLTNRSKLERTRGAKRKRKEKE